MSFIKIINQYLCNFSGVLWLSLLQIRDLLKVLNPKFILCNKNKYMVKFKTTKNVKKFDNFWKKRVAKKIRNTWKTWKCLEFDNLG